MLAKKPLILSAPYLRRLPYIAGKFGGLASSSENKILAYFNLADS